MPQSEPLVSQFMAPQPRFIDANETAANAKNLMETHQIRHLPVLENGKVMGILTDRDLKLAFSLFRQKITSINLAEVKAKDICITDPYHVAPNTPLKDVVHQMARDRIGSVVVTEKEKLVGIFTTVDACMALYVYLNSGGQLGKTPLPR